MAYVGHNQLGVARCSCQLAGRVYLAA
eukprot:COSAG02_NODE_32487_length_515_cov_1.100962_1_plen_26_part_10